MALGMLIPGMFSGWLQNSANTRVQPGYDAARHEKYIDGYG